MKYFLQFMDHTGINHVYGESFTAMQTLAISLQSTGSAVAVRIFKNEDGSIERLYSWDRS